MLFGLKSKIEKQVEKITGARYYNSEDGAGGGDVSLKNDLGMPDEVYDDFAANDPDFSEMMQDDEGGDDDSSGDDDLDLDSSDDAGDDSGEDGDSTDEDSDDEDSGDDDSTDENGDDADQGTSSDYLDNVIEGVTGKDFESLPETVQEALAKHLDTYDEVKQKGESAQTRLEQLLDDPIVKERSQMIDEGRSSYQVRGLTDEEVASIKESIGLDDDETQKLKPLLESVAKTMAEDLANNRVVEADNKRRLEETMTNGRKALLEAVSINPKLAIQEKDPSKLFKENGALNEKHPEYSKAKEGVGKIYEYCKERGLNYQSILKAKPQELYAGFAVANNLPVAFNTKERDQKMIASEREKALSRFLKPKGSPKFGGSSSSGKSLLGKGGKKIGGYDVEKLATDDSYYEKAMNDPKHWGDPDHVDRIDALREKGEAIARKNKKRK